MDKLLKPYVNITHIKHIYWPGTSTNVHSEGEKKKPLHPKSLPREINAVLENMPKEDTLKPYSKIA